MELVGVVWQNVTRRCSVSAAARRAATSAAFCDRADAPFALAAGFAPTLAKPSVGLRAATSVVRVSTIGIDTPSVNRDDKPYSATIGIVNTREFAVARSWPRLR